MANNNRWTILIAVLVCLGITTPMRGQIFEADDRVPTGDCPLCIGIPRAGVITAVNDIELNSGSSPSVLQQGGLVDDARLFLDRDDHFAGDVPTELEGADYVQSSQNNADNVVGNGMEIDIAIDVIEGGIVYLFIDTPEIENNRGFVPFLWMEDPNEWDGNVFFDTGSSFWAPNINGGDSEPQAGDRQFYIYGVGPLNGGTYHIREQDVDSTYLGIAALFGGETVDFDCNADGVLDAGDLTCITAETRDNTLEALGLLPGDLNGDGGVDFPDFLALSANFGDAVDNYTQGDIDLDGSVGFPDFLELSANFGKSAAASAVPEPSSVTLVGLCVGCLVLTQRRRRA